LGSGGFGEVYDARVSNKKFKTNKKKVAVKIVRYSTDHEKRNFLHEVSAMRYIGDHPNIVKLHNYFKVDMIEEAWMELENMEGGTLKLAAAKVSKEQPAGNFTEPEMAYIAKELLSGIKFLHSKNIVHRDLKNVNIMLSIQGDVKIIDFGLCFDCSKGPRIEMVGSPFWMSPEMLRGEAHGKECDVFAFGICMVELANTKPPDAKNVKRAMMATAIGAIKNYGFAKPDLWSEQFKDFVGKTYHPNPKKRATVDQLLDHPWIETACSKSHIKKKLTAIITKRLGSIFTGAF